MTTTNTTLPVTSPTTTPISSSGLPPSSVLSSAISSLSSVQSSISSVQSAISSSRAVITSTAPSVAPSTQVITSIITTSAPPATTQPPETVVVTRISTPSVSSSSTSSATSSTSDPTTLGALDQNASQNSGLGAGGRTAIAVVIPVVVVAALVIVAILLWRRRKQRQSEQAQRKAEMEEYGYNPNNDPTLPVVAATDDVASDSNGGYRGWGAAGIPARKPSTTISSQQMSYNDAYGQHSPTQNTLSDQNSDNTLINRPSPFDGEGAAIAGAGAAAVGAAGGMKRGPSNASSRYSGGDQSSESAEPPLPSLEGQYYQQNAYYQPGPYDHGYGGQQPVIRENPARRNTQIREARVPPHQGATGIAQNF